MNPTHLDAIEHELLAIREIIAKANQNWANEHEGRRLVDLGLVSVKLKTAREHVNELRKESGWIANEQPKERQPNEAKKRAPQKKRPPGVFARDVAAPSSVAMSFGDIGTGEASRPVAANRDIHAVESERRGRGISSDAAYDRAIRDCQDSGSVQRDGSGVE